MNAISPEAIFSFANDRFGSAPEYLWADSPDTAVLRRADNAKWYAVLLPAPRRRLGLDGEGAIDVLDVKCDPILISSLQQLPGFCPAYHMNKSHWLTVLLDGTVSMEQIGELLELSYSLAGGRRKRAAGPSSPK